MMTTSAFEILGPIMVGPSSSHTAGALRIALAAKSLAPGRIKHARFILHNSFSATYKGHGTDKALVAGLLGFSTYDTRVKDSFELAAQNNLEFEFVEAGADPGLHPNTVDIEMTCENGFVAVSGESLGGGRIKLCSINGVDVDISGEYPTIFIAHYDRPGVLAALTGLLGHTDINIATMKTYRQAKGGQAYTVIEIDEEPTKELLAQIEGLDNINCAHSVKVPGSQTSCFDISFMHEFSNGAALLDLCQNENISIGKLMRKREFELAAGQYDPDEEMRKVLDAMREETTATIKKPERSLGGLLYGQAKQVWDTQDALSAPLMGTTMTRGVAYAMAVLERSATMGVIVAAPTAGSAGVVPGSVLACAEALGASDEKILDALWCSAAVGAIIARNASVSGAEGGCQAEVGSAAAMAAASIVELMGADPKTALDAASIAIGNLLGLVCDPVRGLVEYPCQDRNAIGVANALSAAQLSLAGVVNPLPFDEVVSAMYKVGCALPTSLRETAQGGLAACASASKLGCTSCASCGGHAF